MKLKLFAGAALALACIATSGCTSLGGIGLPGSATSSAGQDALNTALASKLDHCGITGSLSIGIGGIAGTGTGLANTVQLNCPGQPYSMSDIPPSVPLAQMENLSPATPKP